MAAKDSAQFKGLPADFFAFFAELEQHNERAWFEPNKARFEANVRAPMIHLVADMAPRLAKISKHYVADPKKSLFRIHRDVRFSKDKSPYKTHAAAQFRHEAGRDVHAPGFYVHAGRADGRDEVFLGAGMWMPPPDALKRVREAILRDPAGWRRCIGDAKFKAAFGGLSDDPAYRLKRPPKGYDPDHPLIDDLKRTSFVFGQSVTPAQARKAGFIERIAAGFAAARPPMRFLCKALDLPF